MTQLNLTNTLVAGAVENVNHVQQNFTDVRTWANGNVDGTNITANTLTDSSFASTAGMYSTYRTIQTATALVTGATPSANDFFFAQNGSISIETVNSGNAPLAFYFDDADYTISGRTPKLRVRAQCLVNATAPTNTIGINLYPISSVTGTPVNFQATLGGLVAGSTVTFATPSASSVNASNSGDFALPADGFYTLGVTFSGAAAGNTALLLSAQLQLRWV